MDYKYIEQLIERYWECETTLLEEHILQSFFSGEDIPRHLLCYKQVFCAHEECRKAHLGSDFDNRILSMIHEDDAVVTARSISIYQRLRPLYQAAAMVAIVLSIGMAAQHSFVDDSQVPSATAQQMSDNPDAEYTTMPAGNTNSSATVDKLRTDTLQSIIRQVK